MTNMTNPDFSGHLSGSEAVKQWFGIWPDFHDEEVISLSLCRRGESVLRVYPYHPENPAMVEFLLTEITDLELSDFSIQNVLGGLRIEQRTNGNGEIVIRLTLFPLFGLGGSIEAKVVQVKLLPGRSSDSGSLW